MKRFVDQGDEVVGVRFLQKGVIGIEPLHRPLQRPPGIETTGARGTVDVLLRLTGGGVEVGPVGAEECEV